MSSCRAASRSKDERQRRPEAPAGPLARRKRHPGKRHRLGETTPPCAPATLCPHQARARKLTQPEGNCVPATSAASAKPLASPPPERHPARPAGHGPLHLPRLLLTNPDMPRYGILPGYTRGGSGQRVAFAAPPRLRRQFWRCRKKEASKNAKPDGSARPVRSVRG